MIKVLYPNILQNLKSNKKLVDLKPNSILCIYSLWNNINIFRIKLRTRF